MLLLLLLFSVAYSLCSVPFTFDRVEWRHGITVAIVSLDHESVNSFFGANQVCEVEQPHVCQLNDLQCIVHRVKLVPETADFDIHSFYEPLVRDSQITYGLVIGSASLGGARFTLYQIVNELLVDIECPEKVEYGACTCVQLPSPCNQALDQCAQYYPPVVLVNGTVIANASLFVEVALPITRPLLPRCVEACPKGMITLGWESCDADTCQENTECARIDAKHYARRMCASFMTLRTEASLASGKKCSPTMYQKQVYLERVYQSPTCCSYVFDWNALSIQQNCTFAIGGAPYERATHTGDKLF